MTEFVWNPADHATYCPQHYPYPDDAGGSSWLCCCSGPLVELRAAGQALIDAADAHADLSSWAEAYDVWVDVVAEQERMEDQWNPDDLRDPDASCEEADLPAAERRRLAAEDRAGEVAFRGEERVEELEREASRGT